MSNSVSTKLKLVKELINEGKIEEALQLVEEIEKMKNLNSEETLKTLFYKADIYIFLWQLENALQFAEELHQKSQEMIKPFLSSSALFIKGRIFYLLEKYDEFYKILEQYEILFKSIPRENSSIFQEKEAELFLLKGFGDWEKRNLDLALYNFNKSITLFEQVDPNYHLISAILIGMGYIYRQKGELELALECSEKALSLTPDGTSFYLLVKKAVIYRGIGMIYYEKGDLNRALEYDIIDLEIQKEIKHNRGMSRAYAFIIQVLITKKDFIQARNYLQQFKQVKEKYESREGYLEYQISNALVLKTSSRMRDRVEAETILKELIEEHLSTAYIPYATNIALITLCEWYFEEFRLSNQMDVLDDIRPLIKHLQKYAKLSNSYILLANTKLLQAKLALLEVSMVEARKLLTEAQKIAEEHGLQLLAGEISREHDHLLEELKLWESFKKTQASVAERLKLASIDGVLERMQGKRAIELPEFDIEEPILLLIMDKSGVTYFNYSFIENWDFSDLFSSFMSAFNTFSGEIFSRSIDRIKIGENTILISPIEPYLACYIIKGQSYPAQQKLTRFSVTIKETTEIWEALNRAAKTSEMLELDNPPSLGSAVHEIFIN